MFMRLEDLEIYQRLIVLEDKIWNIVLGWDYFARDTIGKQFVRSADSMSSNVAEGYGRYFYKENRQFCYYSRGSLMETKGWLLKAKNRKLIADEQYKEFNDELEQIHIKLNAYIKSIGLKMASEQ
ncbi:MAG: four helix bundle protein [Bacteroidetes bacterium]|nr:four helix bundle protein [Bacteroidota bacterium]